MILLFFLFEVLAVVLVLCGLQSLHLLLVDNLDVLLGPAELSDAVGSVVLRRTEFDVLAAGRLQIIARLVPILILLAGRWLALVLALACLLRRFLVLPVRLAVIDVVFDLVQHLLVGLNAVLVIIHIIFLALAGPRVLADHVEIGLSGFLELLILLE